MHTEHYTLDNGLQVLFRQQHTAPVVSMAVWVNVGSADEAPHEAGLAHVHEHMLFKGTQRRGVGEIAREVEVSGGSINAYTSFDQTVYYITMSSRDFEPGLDILADAIQNAAFDPEELTREIQVILEEISRGEDNPPQQAVQKLFSLAYKVHPYSKPIIGTRESVQSFTREDVLAFYRRWYVPANMTLVLVGDIEPQMARQLVAEKFGSAQTVEAPPRVRPAEPSQTQMRVEVTKAQCTEVFLNTTFHIPALGGEDDAALDLLRILLSYGESGRLVARLDRELAWVNDIGASVYMPREPGVFLVSASYIATPEHPGAAAVLEAMFDTCTEPARQLVSAEEILRARTLLESSQIYRRQSVEGQAHVLGFYGTSPVGWNYEQRYFESLRQVTPERLAQVIARYLRPENLSVSLYGPEEALGTIVEDDLRRAATKGLGGKSVLPGARAVQKLERDAYGLIRWQIPEGPTVLFQEDHTVELVSVRTALRAGLRYETPQNAGISNLLGLVWARASRNRAFDEICREVEMMGGSLEGYSGRNSLGLQLDTLSAHTSRGLSLLSELKSEPRIANHELEREKRLLLESIQARRDSPGQVAHHLFQQALFGAHPYAQSVLGEPESLAQLDRETLMQFYRTHIQPQKMVVSAVGNFQAEDMAAQLEERFGKGTLFLGGPPEGAGAPPCPEVPAEVEPHFVASRLPKQQAYIILGFRSLRITDPARYKLDLLSTILSGQGGRLFLELRERQSLAYSVFAHGLTGLDPGFFSFHIATGPEKIARAVEGITAQIHRLCDDLVHEDELERAKQFLSGQHDIQLQHYSSRAFSLALDELYGLGYQEHRRYVDRLAPITTQDLQDISRQLFDLSRATLVVVHPENATLPTFSSLPFGEPAYREI